MWGASAGGHLAALCGLTITPPPAGVVCWYPVTDLLRARPAGRRFVRGRTCSAGRSASITELAVAASPVSHVHAGAPPFLLQHGEADTWVPCDQSVRLAERLRAAGVAVELEVVPGADHFFDGAPDIEAIFERALDFLLRLDASTG